MTLSTSGSKAMVGVAKHYAEELDSQFRILNNFVNQAGEIGRAHETFLRGILTRFLPDNIRLTSGFVAHPNWISRQQDILIHDRDTTTLFEVGDCAVVDYEAFIGAIEVKTKLSSSKEVCEAIRVQAELREHLRDTGNGGKRRQGHIYGIYVWDGVSLDKAVKGLWSYVRKNPKTNRHLIPGILYVRGKYFLMSNLDDTTTSPPYHMWRIGNGGITEGEALLGIVYAIWEFYLSDIRPKPWWLSSWDDYIGMEHNQLEPVNWCSSGRREKSSAAEG